MYFGGVVWYFLAMFPAGGRLLNKDVKDRAFKWPLFMQHELPKVMTSLLNQICMMGDKQNLNLSPQPSSNLLQVCLSQDILRRWHSVLLTFRCYRTFQESKKSNPIKWQNINLSAIQSSSPSASSSLFAVKCPCIGHMFRISGTQTASPDACKTFSG